MRLCRPPLSSGETLRLCPHDTMHKHGIVSCAAARAHRHPIPLASQSTGPHLHLHHQPRVICKSASPGLCFSQLLPAPGSRLHGDAPRRFLCLPCAPRSRRAVLPFVWNRLPWSPSTWRVPGRTREALLRLDKGISWAETSSLGAWARLTLPLLRPLLARRSWWVPCFRAKLLPSCEEFAQGTPRVASTACHAPRSRRVRCFLSGGIDCHGVLRPLECRGAREKLF